MSEREKQRNSSAATDGCAAGNPYADGWNAYKNGRDRYDYPGYDSFEDEAQWVDGWDDARRAAERKKH